VREPPASGHFPYFPGFVQGPPLLPLPGAVQGPVWVGLGTVAIGEPVGLVAPVPFVVICVTPYV